MKPPGTRQVAAVLALLVSGAGAAQVDPSLLARVEPLVVEQIRLAEAEVAAAADAAAGAWSLGHLGRLYHAYGLLDAAAAAYAAAADRAPHDLRWPYYLGHVRSAQGRFDAARDAFAEALAREPGSHLARLGLAQTHLVLGDPVRAAALAGEVLEARPDDPAAWLLTAQAATERSDPAAAAAAYERLLELQPQATRLILPLALAYRGLGETQRARALLAYRGDGDVRIVDPLLSELETLTTGSRVLLNRGVTALQEGRAADAVELLQRAIAADGALLQARENLALAHKSLNDLPAAERQYRAMIGVDARHVEARFGLGTVLAASGRTAEARREYERALQEDPQHRGARFNLANSLRREARCEEAVPHYLALIERDAGDERARLAEALCWIRLGDDGRALERLKAGLAELPSAALLAQLAARLMAISTDPVVRDPQQALRLAEQLASASGTSAHFETLAMALAAAGRFDAAAFVQGKAIAAAEAAAAAGGQPPERLRDNLERYAAGGPAIDVGID